MNLTTITPYWNRPEMLKGWVHALRGAAQPDVKHLIIFVGEDIPDWWDKEVDDLNITAVIQIEPPGMSIGYYHNLGAAIATTEWIMKLDVDTIPNVDYFKALRPVLDGAGPREWFNGGMFYLSKSMGIRLAIPVEANDYTRIVSMPRPFTSGDGWYPQATNWICRREDYLKLGGCREEFRNYGWEDYQQIYMLEKYQRGCDPLPGKIDSTNVTQRCRDEIGKAKAKELFDRDRRLALFHRWHLSPRDTAYRNPAQSERNRAVLLGYILDARKG